MQKGYQVHQFELEMANGTNAEPTQVSLVESNFVNEACSPDRTIRSVRKPRGCR